MIEASLQQILLLCNSASDQIRSLKRAEVGEKHFEGTWSKKEVLGHLCDSAFNNLQRLVRSQVENAPQIFYDQTGWVNVQNYQHYEMEEFVRLWHSLDRHFYHIAYSMNERALKCVCLIRRGINQPYSQ